MLWRQRWTSVDGLGALIISPTRELVSRREVVDNIFYNLASRATHTNKFSISVHDNPIVHTDNMSKSLCQTFFSHTAFDVYFHRQCFKTIGSCFFNLVRTSDLWCSWEVRRALKKLELLLVIA